MGLLGLMFFVCVGVVLAVLYAIAPLMLFVMSAKLSWSAEPEQRIVDWLEERAAARETAKAAGGRRASPLR